MKYEMIHSCIRVMDLEKSEQFYQKAFGFEVARRMDFPEYKFTLLYLVASGGGFELELTYNYDQKEAYELGTGYSHLALGVKDLKTSHQQHEEMGLKPQPLNGLPDGEAKFYFLADPDGYQVEVVRV
jgi:lactoylglutathione lyase